MTLDPYKATRIGSCLRCKGAVNRIRQMGAVYVACERCGLLWIHRRSGARLPWWPGRARLLGVVWVAR